MDSGVDSPKNRLIKPHRKSLCNLIILLITFLYPFRNTNAGYTINFPALGTEFLTGATQYAEIYSQYASAFGKYYAPAVGFSAHLTAPFGKDYLGDFPSISLGTGLGTAFANVNGVKAETNSAVTGSTIPSVLPSLGLTFNAGIGITEKWDAHISIFPSVEFAMPSDLDGLNASFRYSNVKARTSYSLLKSSLLRPGVSIGGYFTWTQGRFNATYDNVSSENFQYDYNGTTANATLNYNLKSTMNWNIIGLGTEVRAWYDLMFLHPYIGYGLGLQTGSLTTDVEVTGDIEVVIPSVGTQTDTGLITINEKSRAPGIMQRFMIGFELSLFLLRIGAEMQFETNTGMAGVAVGVNFVF